MAETKMYGVRFLPALMVIALVCVAAAAGLLAFGGQDMEAGQSSVRSLNELLALSQKIPAWTSIIGIRETSQSGRPFASYGHVKCSTRWP